MAYRGRMRNGVVVLDQPAAIPDGSPVSVRALKPKAGRAARGKPKGKPVRRAKGAETLLESLKPFIGMAQGLPADFSVNHDHYLYGTPKLLR